MTKIPKNKYRYLRSQNIRKVRLGQRHLENCTEFAKPQAKKIFPICLRYWLKREQYEKCFSIIYLSKCKKNLISSEIHRIVCEKLEPHFQRKVQESVTFDREILIDFRDVEDFLKYHLYVLCTKIAYISNTITSNEKAEIYYYLDPREDSQQTLTNISVARFIWHIPYSVTALLLFGALYDKQKYVFDLTCSSCKTFYKEYQENRSRELTFFYYGYILFNSSRRFF